MLIPICPFLNLNKQYSLYTSHYTSHTWCVSLQLTLVSHNRPSTSPSRVSRTLEWVTLVPTELCFLPHLCALLLISHFLLQPGKLARTIHASSAVSPHSQYWPHNCSVQPSLYFGATETADCISRSWIGWHHVPSPDGHSVCAKAFTNSLLWLLHKPEYPMYIWKSSHTQYFV